MNTRSAVEFATPTRIHVGLSVRDVDRSVDFYRQLFAQEPTKLRLHYAKFEVADPPVNLTLHEDASQQTVPGPSAHFGIQVKSADAVAQMAKHLQSVGLTPRLEDATTCCYAVQDKAWVTDPDGNAWEVFVVLEADAPDYAMKKVSASCQGETTTQRGGCAPTACCS
jgi:catechol 2,3-dioxygenase-like lactoylglutathione lyase family enzyme